MIKHWTKRLSALLLCAVMLLTVSMQAAAKEYLVTDEYGAETNYYVCESEITDFTVSTITATTAKLSWYMYPCWCDEGSGFEILLDKDNTGEFKSAAFFDADHAEEPEYTLKNLKPATTYACKVRHYEYYNGQRLYGETGKKFVFSTSPKATKLTSVKYEKKGKVKLKWNKASGATGYLIQYCPGKKFRDPYTTTKYIKSKKTSCTIGGIAKGEYYFRVIPYRTIGNTRYFCGKPSNAKKVKVKKGCTLKESINYTKTDLSGRKAIKALTYKGVDIKKYDTTYDRIKAIYNWHAKNYKKRFGSCVECNYSFCSCLDALYGGTNQKHETYFDKYIVYGDRFDLNIALAAGEFQNNNGSRSIHKWAVVYVCGKPYIFDPRLQGYTGDYTGNLYFGVKKGSSLQKRYLFEYWYSYYFGY